MSDPFFPNFLSKTNLQIIKEKIQYLVDVSFLHLMVQISQLESNYESLMLIHVMPKIHLNSHELKLVD